MAFDISQLFGQSAVNRLLNPSADAPQNFLTNPEAARRLPTPRSFAQAPQAPQQQVAQAQDQQKPDPWAGLREATVDPMQTGSIAPQHSAQDYVDHRSTRNKLFDMFSGWAAGNSIGESLALGAQGYRGQNQTVKYLMNHGYNQEDAEAINGNHDALNLALTNIFSKQNPEYALKVQQAQANLEKTQRDLNTPRLLSAGDGRFLNQDSGEFITAPGGSVKDTPDIQNYKFAKDNGYNGDFSDFITERARAGHNSAKPVLSVDGSDLDLNSLPAVEVDGEGRPSADQQKAFLSKLPPATAAQVQGIVDGRVDLTKSTSMKDGQRQAYSQLASMYDPNFDMSMGPLRAQTRKNYGPGGYMGNMRDSTNLAIQHLGELKDAYDKMGNGNWKLYNKAHNWWNDEGGAGPISSYKAAVTGAKGELEKTFTGSNGTENGRSDWADALNENSSPQQIHDAISTAAKMLAARVNTYNTGWDNAMHSKNQFPMLTQKTIDTLHAMGIDPSELGVASQTQNGPKAGTIEDGHRFKGGDPSDPQNWEKL